MFGRKRDGYTGALREQVTSLKDDLAGLRSEFAEWAHDVADSSRYHKDRAAKRLRKRMRKRADQFQHAAHEAREQGRHAVDTARHCVQDHPFLSALACLGAGLLLGTILRWMR